MLKELIYDKWKEAFKARDVKKSMAYEFIKQEIVVAEKSGKFELPLADDVVIDIIRKEIKKRGEVLQLYPHYHENYSLAQFIITELEQYLPKQLTEEEVIAIIMRHKLTESNVGKIIGLTVKEVGNRFDKSRIATLVKSM